MLVRPDHLLLCKKKTKKHADFKINPVANMQPEYGGMNQSNVYPQLKKVISRLGLDIPKTVIEVIEYAIVARGQGAVDLSVILIIS